VGSPLCGRMSCNVKVHNAPAVMGEYDEHKQNLERNRVQ
jgi:hypothetical protein